MSDTNETVVNTLDTTKLYALARSTQLLQFLIPEIPTQAAIEVEIDKEFPRVEEDSDHTRILINYTNLKGNSTLYKFTDTERLQRRFDIDLFMNGFVSEVVGHENTDGSVDSVNASILSALNFAVATVTGLIEGPDNKNTKIVSDLVLSSLISIVYDDALDVIIALQERPLQDDQEQTESIIAAMWIVKQRPPVED